MTSWSIEADLSLKLAWSLVGLNAEPGVDFIRVNSSLDPQGLD